MRKPKEGAAGQCELADIGNDKDWEKIEPPQITGTRTIGIKNCVCVPL